MTSFLRVAFFNPAAAFLGFLFVALLAWWGTLHFIIPNPSSEALQLWGASYQVLAWFGAIAGLVVSHRWGGIHSYMGRAIIAFSLGLLLQSFGQTTYSLYVYALQIDIPYPSIGDLGFFGSIPCYLYGALTLAHVSGAKLSLKSMGSRVGAFLIPLILLGCSYYLFLRGYEFDFSMPLQIFLDFGYPLGQAAYVAAAVFALVFSRKYLGGIMRLPLMLFISALVVQYLCDSMFLYEAAQGIFYSGGWNDLLYATSYFLMALALLCAGSTFSRIRET